MPDKCCVPNCRPNYCDSESVSFHQFPYDPTTRDAWIRSIPRKFEAISKQARVCSEHFCEHDFTTVSSDSNVSRRKKRQETKVEVKRKLKPTAIPHIFRGCPNYLTTTCKLVTKRTSPAERDLCFEKRQQSMFDDFLKEDCVSTLQEILSKMDRTVVSGFVHSMENDMLPLY